MTKIAVIDDDQALVELLAESLSLEGFDVLKGYDGQMALRLAKTQHPRLMVLDVNMPFGSGLDTLEKLRADRDTYDIPVIFLTGEASAKVYPAIETASRVTYLKKPIDLEELHSIVRHVLASQARLADPR